MSSNKRLLLAALALALFGYANAQNTAKPAAMPCPGSIKATASATVPPGWTLDAPTSDHALQRISVFQKSSAGEVFDLAPDRISRKLTIVEQLWTVPHDAAHKTYLRCRYRNTDATLVAPLESGIKACRFKFVADSYGAVTAILNISCR